jgi:hypothetical protein
VLSVVLLFLLSPKKAPCNPWQKLVIFILSYYNDSNKLKNSNQANMKSITLIAAMVAVAGAFALGACKSKNQTYTPPPQPGYVDTGK